MNKSLLDHFFGKLSLGLLTLLCLSFSLIYWIQGLEIDQVNPSKIGLINGIHFSFFWFNFVFNLLILVASTLIWGQILRRFKLIEGSKWPIYLLFFVGISIYPELLLGNAIISYGLILIGLNYYFLQIYNQVNIKYQVFVASLLLGLGGLICSASPLFLLVLWLGIALIRPFNLKVYLLSLISFLLPFAYFYGLAYLFDYSAEPLLELETIFKLKMNSSSDWVEVLFMVFLLAMGLFNLSLRAKMIVLIRNQKAYLLLALISSLFLVLFWDADAIYLAFFPAAVFVQNTYDSLVKKWIFDLALLLFLLFQITSLIFL